MKKLKVIGSIICFFFYASVFLNAVDFKTQSDVDNAGNWTVLNAGNPGIFYGDFFYQRQSLSNQAKAFLPMIQI
jgi:hypothetical protein